MTNARVELIASLPSLTLMLTSLETLIRNRQARKQSEQIWVQRSAEDSAEMDALTLHYEADASAQRQHFLQELEKLKVIGHSPFSP